MKLAGLVVPLLIGAAAFSGPAAAHHSTAAYDFTKSETLEGTVRSFQWANPHNYIQLVVTDAKGAKKEWSIEAGTPATATRQGWNRNVLKPGDKVTVVIAPMRDGSPGGTLRTIRLADGTTLNSVAADPNATSPFERLPELKRATPK